MLRTVRHYGVLLGILLFSPNLAMAQKESTVSVLFPVVSFAQEPTLEETTAFLQSKLSDLTASTSVVVDGQPLSISYHHLVFRIEKCTVDWIEKASYRSGVNLLLSPQFHVQFNFGMLDSKSIRVEEVRIKGATPSPPIFAVNILLVESVRYEQDGKDESTKQFRIEIMDKALAEDIAKALGHAAALCSAKKEDF